MTDIRKISIGSDYKSAMHYIVGQKVLSESCEIYHIKHNSNSDSILVFIINEKNEVILWKEFRSSVPVSIEFNINY